MLRALRQGTEDALYDSQAIRRFVGIDLGREAAPDATTLLKFRRALERYGLTRRVFETINAPLAEQGLLLREGTIVDATIIAAPSSTKNRKKARDPQMHQVKKGKQYYFGMKAHVGVDAHSGLVHSLIGTAANVCEVTQAQGLLHGGESDVFGDTGYQGVGKRAENRGTDVAWRIAMKRGARKALPDTDMGAVGEQMERVKASIRAKVEHPFHVVKNLLGYRKTRYRGLAKNEAHLFALFGLANLMLARRRLQAIHAQNPF